MSIIYDALRKAEGHEPEEAIPVPAPVLKPRETPKIFVKSRPRRRGKRGDKSLGLAIICLGIIVSFFIYNFLARPIKDLPGSSGPVERIRQPEAAAKKIKEAGSSVAAAAKAFDSKEYILEGIVYDEGSPFAVINGQVVKTYDTIGAFIIKQINQEEVEMVNVDGSRKLTLSLY